MRINETDIIEEIEAQIRKFGGDFTEWCVGTAQDKGVRCQVSGVSGHDTESLLCREAYTPYAADEVIERLVQGCGLRRDQASVRERGPIVFVYRKAQVESTASGDHRDVAAKLAA